LSLDNQLSDKIANNNDEIRKRLWWDIEVGPDGYHYILSINHEGYNCVASQVDQN
jgi:hypothetical protein